MAGSAEDANRRLLRARDAMDRAYAQELDVPALARIAHVSEAHFIRTFRATFGETPHRYLQRRRIERAMFLLRTTDRPVTDICLDVGFTSLGTFGRTFRAVVGEAPTAYRRRQGPLAVPTCFAMAWTRPSSFGEADPPERGELRGMFTAITHSAIYVLDQDEALEFYVGKLGLEVVNDVDLGFMRWLTVCVPGRPEREILLERPGPPAHDDATTEVVRGLVTKGAMGLGFILTTDDIHKTYEELKAKGVEFNQEPMEQSYGIDAGIRDPFGNHLRVTQVPA